MTCVRDLKHLMVDIQHVLDDMPLKIKALVDQYEDLRDNLILKSELQQTAATEITEERLQQTWWWCRRNNMFCPSDLHSDQGLINDLMTVYNTGKNGATTGGRSLITTQNGVGVIQSRLYDLGLRRTLSGYTVVKGNLTSQKVSLLLNDMYLVCQILLGDHPLESMSGRERQRSCNEFSYKQGGAIRVNMYWDREMEENVKKACFEAADDKVATVALNKPWTNTSTWHHGRRRRRQFHPLGSSCQFVISMLHTSYNSITNH